MGESRGFKGAEFRPKGAAAVVACPEQRFHPEAITGQGETLGLHLPAGHREDAVQTAPEPFPPALEAPQQHLGVTAGAEDFACRFQLPSQLKLVVDLSVEHQRQGAGIAQHRLVAERREVLDRQPRVQQPCQASLPAPSVIGAASVQGFEDRRFGKLPQPDTSEQTAHIYPFP